MALRKHGTLVAATPATVTVAAPADTGLRDAEINEVTVVNRGGTGADDIFFTTDGSAPVVGADDTYAVPVGGFIKVGLSVTVESLDVKLISSGTPRYTVEAATTNVRR